MTGDDTAPPSWSGGPGEAAGPPVRVLLGIAAPLLRAGYRTVLGADPGLLVVAEAADGAEAVELARRLLPDVAVLDARLPRLDGLAVASTIAAARLPVRVLLLADPPEDGAGTTVGVGDPVIGALSSGEVSLLDTDPAAAALAPAVRTVAAGHLVLAPRFLRRLLPEGAAVRSEVSQSTARLLGRLTEREQEVLVALARGLSNAEIARSLSVGETTVKTHVGRVLAKLELRDRVQATVLAYESGLIRPGGFPSRTAG